jgi:hypothetical protein
MGGIKARKGGEKRKKEKEKEKRNGFQLQTFRCQEFVNY